MIFRYVRLYRVPSGWQAQIGYDIAHEWRAHCRCVEGRGSRWPSALFRAWRRLRASKPQTL